MPNRFPFNTPEHPEDNRSINKAFDRNYGNRLKSGDTTPLKYTIKDGDGEPLDKERLPNMQTSLILKYEGVTAYKTEFEATLEEVTENYVGDLVARFRIDEALPPSDTPYVVEFHFEDDEDLFIFPSVNTLELYITPSSLNSDGEAIKNASEQRLNEIVERKLDENPVLSEAEANELARQENYQELLDTGVMQTKINERLEDLEEEYAPKLTEVTAQLAQTVDDVNRAASELTQDSEIILARGSYDYLGERLEDIDRRLTAQVVVMGVEWDKQPDPTLTRIGASEDLVANIGIGSEVVRNDFDQMPIYREIQKEVDMYGNVFVRIPRFYIRKTVTDSLKRIEISTEKLKDFYLPAIFYDFENQKELPYAHIGAYNAGISLDGTKLESKAGVKPLVSRNIVDFRSLAQANGVGYQQLDIHAVDVIQSLFYVEFATLNSQSIHPGYTFGDTESLESGFSDGVAASSGALGMSGTDGFVYRGIENPWGNVYQWTDGVNISDHQAWVCKDAENYASNVFVAPYEKLGYVNHPENGVVKDMGFDSEFPYAEFPDEIGASYTTHYADHYYQNTGQRVAPFGGSWSYGSSAGLSHWYLNSGSSTVHSAFGGRLLRKSL